MKNCALVLLLCSLALAMKRTASNFVADEPAAKQFKPEDLGISEYELVDSIPSEVLLLIFANLPNDIKACSCVNKAWHSLIESEAARKLFIDCYLKERAAENPDREVLEERGPLALASAVKNRDANTIGTIFAGYPCSNETTDYYEIAKPFFARADEAERWEFSSAFLSNYLEKTYMDGMMLNPDDPPRPGPWKFVLSTFSHLENIVKPLFFGGTLSIRLSTLHRFQTAFSLQDEIAVVLQQWVKQFPFLHSQLDIPLNLLFDICGAFHDHERQGYVAEYCEPLGITIRKVSNFWKDMQQLREAVKYYIFFSEFQSKIESTTRNIFGEVMAEVFDDAAEVVGIVNGTVEFDVADLNDWQKDIISCNNSTRLSPAFLKWLHKGEYSPETARYITEVVFVSKRSKEAFISSISGWFIEESHMVEMLKFPGQMELVIKVAQWQTQWPGGVFPFISLGAGVGMLNPFMPSPSVSVDFKSRLSKEFVSLYDPSVLEAKRAAWLNALHHEPFKALMLEIISSMPDSIFARRFLDTNLCS